MKLIILCLILWASTSFAQSSQTLYFDKNSQVTSQQGAYFYTVITPDLKNTELFFVETFLLNGAAWLSGTYKAIVFPPEWDKLYLYDFQDATKHGTHWEFYDNGRKRFQGEYANGLLEGRAKRFHENGNLSLEYDNKKGIPDGELLDYDVEGKLKQKKKLKDGKLVD